MLTSASNKEILQKADRYRLRAHRKARAHYLFAKELRRKHTYLGVPVVIASTVVGTTIFATLSSEPTVGWKILTGLVSIAAAVLASLQTFFNYAEQAEKQRTAAASYSTLFRQLDLFCVTNANSVADQRAEILRALSGIVANIDKLEHESPDVPDSLYDQAVREQKADKEGV